MLEVAENGNSKLKRDLFKFNQLGGSFLNTGKNKSVPFKILPDNES